ncbi:YlaI family protein [Gracilibacillus sp. S3-1-1]|uniref:YlaI family protein n=1 Tax=Gracilibacillus pellucidus TaxID=3095368 RepID=A0ACC6M1R8_9BACI|nr:YlaI family protein [Gracilibacillus sp. S3-1-1]MDX8044890.1 YlaI family protein [Gracilibacillus sp. S3-1-1]
MRVKCVMCDKINNINNDCAQAKKLRNRLISTYMCSACDERIKEKTMQRHHSGNFNLYQKKEVQDQYIS